MSTELTIYNGDADFAGMRQSDISMPRVRLTQSLSPWRKERKADDGDYFDTGSQRVIRAYNDAKPMMVIPLAFAYAWIEWNPNKKCAKAEIIKRQSTVPGSELEKMALSFEKVVNSEGKEVLRVTEYYNYICALPEYSGNLEDLFTLSFYRSTHKIGKEWLNRMRRCRMADGKTTAPMWFNSWAFTAKEEKNAAGEGYIVPAIGAATAVPKEWHTDLHAKSSLLREMKAKVADMAANQAADDGQTDDAPSKANSEFT